MSSPRLRRRKRPGGASNYVALAGEFYVLAELARRRLDGTLTLGQTKEIDILVLNRRTGRTFKVEVKTTEGGMERRRDVGEYHWLMHERHERVRDPTLIYGFVALEKAAEGEQKPRIFLVRARDVAQYIRWSHKYWLRHPRRKRSGKPSSLRVFRISTGQSRGVLPPSWRAGRWKGSEGNWRIFGPSPPR